MDYRGHGMSEKESTRLSDFLSHFQRRRGLGEGQWGGTCLNPRNPKEHSRARGLRLDVSGCPQGRPQVLGGDTVTLQKLESTIVPLKGMFTFSSQMTPEESDFLETVSARSGCPTLHS